MHVVRAPGGKVAFAAKSQLTLIDAYVDTSDWTAANLADHPGLVAALTRSGKMDVLSHVTSVTLNPSVHQDWSRSTHAEPRPTQKTAAPEEPRQKSIFDVQ